MKNFIKKILSIFTAIYLFFYNQTTSAVEVGEFLDGKLPEVNSKAWTDSSAVIANIIVYLIGIVAILAIIAITWSAIQMFLSVGDEAKFNKAKKILITALVGVGVAGGWYAIVTIITRLSF